MDVKAILRKLKENSEDGVAAWADTINRRRDEALATLREEGMKVESWFLLTLNDEVYLLSYMRSEDLEKAYEVGKQSKHEIDAIHQQFKKDAWVRGSTTELELLVDLAVDEDK